MVENRGPKKNVVRNRANRRRLRETHPVHYSEVAEHDRPFGRCFSNVTTINHRPAPEHPPPPPPAVTKVKIHHVKGPRRPFAGTVDELIVCRRPPPPLTGQNVYDGR